MPQGATFGAVPLLSPPCTDAGDLACACLKKRCATRSSALSQNSTKAVASSLVCGRLFFADDPNSNCPLPVRPCKASQFPFFGAIPSVPRQISPLARDNTSTEERKVRPKLLQDADASPHSHPRLRPMYVRHFLFPFQFWSDY